MIRFVLLCMFVFSGCVTVTQNDLTHINTHDSFPKLEQYPGEMIPLDDHAWLYIPSNQYLKRTIDIQLSFHFHTALPSAIHEHVERQSKNPLIIINSGSGSNAYKIPFENTKRFDQLQTQALQACIKAGASNGANIGLIELLSFSAGYGAVREILKNPAYVKKIQRVVLADSMYAGFANAKNRLPKQEDIQPFVDYAHLAAKGEKEFILTYSQVETESYASTGECVQAVVNQVGGRLKRINVSVTGTGQTEGYAIITRFDRKGFHVLGFAGNDASAHLAHIHSLAEMMNALMMNK